MKKSTRDIIIEQGSLLLEQQGFSNLSMRDIAKKANISVGNLTYYFKTKEDVLLELIEHLPDELNQLSVPSNIQELDNFFELVSNNQNLHLYRYHNYQDLAKEFPKLYQQINQRYLALENLVNLALTNLENNKEIKVIAPSYIKQNLIKALLALSVYKIPQIDAKQDNATQVKFCLWSLIYPYLTIDGWATYKMITKTL